MHFPDSQRVVMSPILVFDIETIPDTDGLRALYATDDLTTPRQLAEIAFLQRRQTIGSDFLQPHLQRVVAISCALLRNEECRVWSLGQTGDSEAGIIQSFFDSIDQYSPLLVSWNGNGFHLPVLHYRSLIHQTTIPRQWRIEADEGEFKKRPSCLAPSPGRHLDLMNALNIYPAGADIPHDDLARLCGFPGKRNMNGSQVWDAYLAGQIAELRHDCETGAANTYLLYLRYRKVCGALDTRQYQQECARFREYLEKNDALHWQEFLAAWSPD